MERDAVFEELVEAAQASEVSLGTAESVTGGQLAYLMTGEPGVGDVFRGAIVAYQTSVKRDLLEVPEGPVVSHEAARAMAEGARRLLGCDLAVSITGVAGPERQDGQPVGCVFIGLAFRDEPATSGQHFFEGEPDQIRKSAASTAARVALDRLTGLRPTAT